MRTDARRRRPPAAHVQRREAKLNAYLEDHAYLVEALLTLYQSTFEVRWFDAARETADAMIARFADPDNGGFFTTSIDHEQLIARRKDIDDHPIPSGNSAAALGLLQLAALTGEQTYERHAVSVFRLFARAAGRIRTPSPICCERSTSTSPRSRRWRWWRRREPTASISSRPPFARASDRTSCSLAVPKAPSAPS